MLRRLFFLAVKAFLVIVLVARPHSLAKGQKVYHHTAIANQHKQAAQESREPLYRVVEANVSAYTANSDECGKNDGITASGKRAIAGRTIEMDGVPFGTKVEIDGHIYTVEDRFGGGYTNRIDIFMDTKHEAFQFGRRYLQVKIFEA